MRKGFNERGQVALFVIIGLLLVGIVVVVFLFTTKVDIGRFGSNKIKLEIAPVYNSLVSCIEERSLDAVYLIGLQAGYSRLPKNYVQARISNVPYGLYENKNVLLSLEEIEENIENYLGKVIPYCVNEDNFKNMEIIKNNVEVNVKIKDDEVIIDSRMPMSIKEGNNSFSLDEAYDVKIPIRLGEIHSVVNVLIDNLIEDSEYIDITYLSNMDYNVMFIPVSDEDMIYIITDEELRIEDVKFSFVFATKQEEVE